MRIFHIFTISAMSVCLCACNRSGEQTSSDPAPAASTPINDMGVSVTVTAIADGDTTNLDGYVNSNSNLHMATVITVAEGAGQSIRMIDDVHSSPSISKSNDGSYVLVFRYQPENRAALLGRDVRELQGVTSVNTRYSGVLSALGLSPSKAKVTHLIFSANGREMVSADVDAAIGPEGEDFQPVEIARFFKP